MASFALLTKVVVLGAMRGGSGGGVDNSGSQKAIWIGSLSLLFIMCDDDDDDDDAVRDVCNTRVTAALSQKQ